MDEKLKKYLCELPPNQEKTAYLLSKAGYAYNDIAKQLKIKTGTVSSHIFKFRTKLRDYACLNNISQKGI